MTAVPSQARRLAPLLLWTGVLVFLVALRLHTLREPLEADESVYMLLAQDWRQGGQPYRTLWDNKPIGTFLLYRAGIATLGYAETTPKLMALAAVLAATLLLGGLLRRERLWRQGLLLSGWAMLLVLTACFANGANMEIFLLPFLLGGQLCLYRHLATQDERWLWAACACYALSLLFKQVTLPFLALPFLPLLPALWRQRRRPAAWAGFALRALLAALLVVALHLAVYAACGYSPGELLDQLRQNAGYTAKGQIPLLLRLLRDIPRFPFDKAVIDLLPLTAAAAAGFAGALWRHRPQRAALPPVPGPAGSLGEVLLDLAGLGAALLAIALPGGNIPHYYILALPFLLLGCRHLLALLPRPAWLAPALGLALGLYLGQLTWRQYLALRPEEISLRKYTVNWFLHDRAIGRQMVARGLTGGRLWCDGSHPGIYFYSGNLPGTKHFVNWTVGLGVSTAARNFQELVAARPEYIVGMNPAWPVPELPAWLAANYFQSRDDIYGARIYVRQDLIPH